MQELREKLVAKMTVVARLALWATPFVARVALLLGYSRWGRPHLGIQD